MSSNHKNSTSEIPPMVVQLINDDGPESPLLEPFLSQLKLFSWIKELRVVVPAVDKSWIGSAMSRKGGLSVKIKRIGDFDVHLIDGTPGDCANLGLFSLFSSPADLIISGPNLGQNTGGPFTICSGTLGGALIGFLGGASAIAVSSEMTPEYWDKKFNKLGEVQNSESSQEWQRIAITAARLIERSLKAELHRLKAVVNINLPWGANLDSEVVITRVQSGTLLSFFEKGNDGQFHHSFKFPTYEANDYEHLDHDSIVQKKVSISMLKPMHAALELSEEKLREIKERLKC